MYNGYCQHYAINCTLLTLLYIFVPPVAFGEMDGGVVALAEAHEIALVVCSSIGQRNDVVYHLCGDDPAFLLTQLTQRVLHDEAVTDVSPFGTVAFVDLRFTLEVVVVAVDLLQVLGAVKTVGQLSAAGVST